MRPTHHPATAEGAAQLQAVRHLLGGADPLHGGAPSAGLDDDARDLLHRVLASPRDPRSAPAAAQHPPGARRPGRRTVLGAGVLGVAAAAATVVLGAGVVTLPGQQAPADGAYAATPPLPRYAPLPAAPGATSSPAGAAAELTAVAARTAVLPDDTGTGPYARVETSEWSLWTRVDGAQVTSAVVPQQTTTWTAADGSGRTSTTYTPPEGRRVREDATSAPGEHSSLWPLGSLSADDAELARQLALGHPASNGPAERWVAVTDAAREQPLSPPVRAALLRYLAATPGLELLGATTDRAGRAGIGVALESAYSGLPTRYTVVVDPADGRVLAWEEELTTTAGLLDVPVPSVIGYTVLLDAAYTADDDR